MSIATRIQSINEHIEDAYDSLNKMGVTANDKNIENIAGLVDQIYENAPKTDYVSGVDLTIENTLKGKIDYKDTDSIEKIGFGNTTQDGTTGKNKIWGRTDRSDMDIGVSKTSSGITYVRTAPNTWVFNGKATADFTLVMVIAANLQEALTNGNTYTISGCPSRWKR